MPPKLWHKLDFAMEYDEHDGINAFKEYNILNTALHSKQMIFDPNKADQTLEHLNWRQKGSTAKSAMNEKARSVFGNSPYLASLAKRYPAQANTIIQSDPDEQFASIITSLQQPREADETDDSFMSFLRDTKNIAGLLIALADISGLWSLEKVTRNLSQLAKSYLELAVAKALRVRMRANDLPWPAGINDLAPITSAANVDCGYFLLAMGKLGGQELNYSSDIDLIALYDPEKTTYIGKKSISDCFIKLTQDVVRYIDQRTMNGYVFRVDLRLRPDPSATPVALSVEGALGYYHSIAANWERSAMIKAAFAAGDPNAADQYLGEMSSWVWRRNMDFEALRDIASIKNQINRHYSVDEATFRGFDVKIGIGGIREVEFFAQVNQLLHGGRNPSLRKKATIATLRELASLNFISDKACSELTDAYEYFRKVEHRIQMINDEQTHTIPEDDYGLTRLTYFLEYKKPSEFEKALTHHTKNVCTYYDQLLPDVEGENNAPNEKQIRKYLSEHGFDNPDTAFTLIQSWNYGRYRSLKTSRARELLVQCLPALLLAFSKTHSPDAALTRFDAFLAQLPAGVQLFSLLQANPSLLGLLTKIIGLAPALSSILAKAPWLWDTVLSAQFFAPPAGTDILRRQLKTFLSTARDYQDQLDFLRRFYAEQKFRSGVLMLEGLASAAETGASLSVVTDVILQELIPIVENDFAQKHGDFGSDSDGIAVIALGKYGGFELTHTSDIDIIFLYENAENGVQSNGKKPLFSNVYYTRLAQHIVTAITALTPEGRLFDVDTRLRPSGSQGPLAVTIKTLEDYYLTSAWTWEFLALTRARIIQSPASMAPKVQHTLDIAIATGPPNIDLATETASMRKKLHSQFGTDNIWDVKHTLGGLVDIEFICQFLTLRHAKNDQYIARPNTPNSLTNLHQMGYLLPIDYSTLSEGYELQQTIQSLIRLCLDTTPNEDQDIPSGLQNILINATSEKSFAALKKHVFKQQQACHAIFKRIISDD